jgi:malonate-semialdehyde dehydrogenase (acetylating)/methylmalonate-semialdehyde dehydrogenase
MVTKAQLDKVKSYVDLGLKEGAKLRSTAAASSCKATRTGFFMGGCLFDEVTPDMRIYKEEILRPGAFGGARQELRGGAAASLRARLRQRRRHLHPRRRHRARLHQPGQCRHGGRELRDSRCRSPTTPSAAGSVPGFGDLNQHGPDSVRFYTKTKTVTSRWPSGTKEGAEFVIPTMK